MLITKAFWLFLQTLPTVVAAKLSVTPPIADDYFIIDYVLADKENTEDISFVVYNDRGNKLLTKNPLTSANQYLIECKNWQEGLYYCRKLVNGQQTEELQFVIDRTKSYAVVQTALAVYPNPANDYFIVQIGDAYLVNASIEVLDTKGVLVQQISVNKDQNQLLINTATWQSGVYILNLKTNKEFVASFKIIIE